MAKLLERRKATSRLAPVPGSGSVEHCTLSSDILGVEKEFSIYLPDGYEDGTESYPVVYLFHPAGANHQAWIRMGGAPQIADDAIRSGMAVPMIIVMPDAAGEDEFHTGRHMGFFSVADWDYERFFTEEFIPLIDAEFRTSANKIHRAIAGASMGGEAAVAYAQKHPELYGSACALCGILGHPEQSIMAQGNKEYADSLIANNPAISVENADQSTVEKLRSVRWYADCGDRDYFVDGNLQFFLAMRQKGIAMDMRMRSGVHGWYYWTSGLAPILQFISIGFGAGA